MTGLVQFSIDAASNDVAAPPINFVEGQAANSVNNSMREVMAALARWHADLVGDLTATGGAGNALFVSTNQTIPASAFSRYFEIAFRMDAANTGPCTLSVDGFAARSIRRPNGTVLAPGDLPTGAVVRVRRMPVENYYVVVSPEIVPAGRFGHFGSEDAVPGGWLLCTGQLLSRATYGALFSAIGSRYGAGDGSTTFAAPDARGRTLFGADNQGGTDAGRLSAAGGIDGTVGSSGGSETVTLTEAQIAPHDHDVTLSEAGGVTAGETGPGGGHSHGTEEFPAQTGSGGGHSHDGTIDNSAPHKHSGATNADNHAHGTPQPATKTAVAGSGSEITGLWAGNGGAGTTNGVNLTLPFETANGGVHDHEVDIEAAPPHRHAIPSEPPHKHSIPAIPPHDHELTLAPAGGGQAHSNMPPGLCGVIAIKA